MIKLRKIKEKNQKDNLLPDMESDGVYFSDNIKEDLKKIKEKELCHYSGLPSVYSYK